MTHESNEAWSKADNPYASSPVTTSVRASKPKRSDNNVLTDVLIVGVVLLLLFGIVGLMSWAAFAPIERQARIKAAMAQIGMFESALGLYEERIDSDSGLRIYRIDVGDYPSTEQGLEALMVSPPNTDGWQGPYLAKCSRKNDLGNSFDAGIGKSGVKSVPVVQVIYARMLKASRWTPGGNRTNTSIQGPITCKSRISGPRGLTR